MQNLNFEVREQDSYVSIAAKANLRAATVWQSFGYAFSGLWYVFCTQRNAKIHVVVACLVILVGGLLRLTGLQWAILAITIGLVLAAEIFNTAIEALVDLVSPDFHPLAKIAKDASAGAVLVLVVMGVTVGLLILGPPLWLIVSGVLFG